MEPECHDGPQLSDRCSESASRARLRRLLGGRPRGLSADRLFGLFARRLFGRLALILDKLGLGVCVAAVIQ